MWSQQGAGVRDRPPTHRSRAHRLGRGAHRGDARTDVDDDIARYIMGAAVMNFASEQQRQRMLAVLFDGLRAR